MGNEGKKPQIHVRGEAPLSPYVIDLRRPILPVLASVAPTQKQEHRFVPKLMVKPPRPHEIVAISFDPTHDLLPTRQDLLGQLAETDLVDVATILPFERNMKPLITGSTADLFTVEPADPKTDPIAAAFSSLQLPETETGEVIAWDDAPDDEIEIPPPVSIIRLSWPTWRLPHGWQKTIAAFVGLSFLFVLPIHAMQQVEQAQAQRNAITAVGANALKHLSLGQADLQGSDFALAEEDFARASESFQSAEARLQELSLGVNALLRALPSTGAKLAAADALVSAGEKLSQAASLFTQALSELTAENDDSPIVKLDILTLYLERMQPLVEDASQKLSAVDANLLPSEYASSMHLINTTLPDLSASLNQFLSFNQAIRLMLGGEGPMRYLVLFQNNTEARATGGFIGSYAEVTMENGKILAIDVPGGGSYDLQGSLSEFVRSPAPLSLVNPRFEFQDANWFPDFPASAEKLLHFYDYAGGPTIDGVLAVNATFVESLLALLGPVEMDAYGRTITSENFLTETQKIVELESDKTLNKPKQFIADLTPKLLDRLTASDAQTFLGLLQTVGQGLSQKEIQLYFTNDTLEQSIDELGWSGRVAQTDGDYLMLVNTNVGGGKTDLVMDEEVDVKVEINDDGSIINTTTITRTHNGAPTDPFSGVNNVNYLRLFVPIGSTLLSANGDFAAPDASLFETSELDLQNDPDLTRIEKVTGVDAVSGTIVGTAFEKTTFGNWVQTKPGETSTVTFRYLLPFQAIPEGKTLSFLRRLAGMSETVSYRLLVQKQSGALARSTHVTIFPPDSLTPIWSSDDTLSTTGTAFSNTTDTYLATLFSKR